MSDTQWPRWEVFKQDGPNRPHQAVGTVHAADAEHALLAARNVFVRRPSAVSLWVAPADSVLTATLEELADAEATTTEAASDRTLLRYQVFCKVSYKPSLSFADYQGELEAASLRDALARAHHTFPVETPLTWMIVPEDTLARTKGEDVPSWFEPAKTKTYKQQSAYGTVKAAPKVKPRAEGM